MKPPIPKPTLKLSRTEARRFLLVHQGLWPPRSLEGKEGILALIRRVGCIQYDPINVVGRNPDLVLQARVAGYAPRLLEELLYTDRLLWDGWDKVGSIYAATDWPCFARYRARVVERWGTREHPAMQIAGQVMDAIRERGPLCSSELEHKEMIDWEWGVPTRQGRAALEVLLAMGELGIHHRSGTRRYFDLVERLLPADVLATPDPNATTEAYQDWHVLRRVGSAGLAAATGSAELWLGILDKSEGRRAALGRLAERGEVAAVEVEGMPVPVFVRTADLAALETIRHEPAPEPRASFIAPLDNLTWDRQLLRLLFGFDYKWEVYTPAEKRRYGYYVLPVLYGDRFVARFDPVVDKRTRELVIRDWWWEEGVEPDGAMGAALGDCLRGFVTYVGAGACRVGPACRSAGSLGWVQGAR